MKSVDILFNHWRVFAGKLRWPKLQPSYNWVHLITGFFSGHTILYMLDFVWSNSCNLFVRTRGTLIANVMSQNKTFIRNLQTLEKISCTNLKFDLKLVTLARNYLWHTWNLKLSTTWKTFLAHTSNLKVETLNNLKNSLSHTFSNFMKPSITWRIFFHTLWISNLKLKDLKNTLPHLRIYNTLKKSLPHLPFTWKSCKVFICHHFEMNSHSPCKLKKLLSKGFFFF